MILLINIFIHADMIYGKVLLVMLHVHNVMMIPISSQPSGEMNVYIKDAHQVHVIGRNHLFQNWYPQRWSVLQPATLVSSILLVIGYKCTLPKWKIIGRLFVKWRCWYTLFPWIDNCSKPQSNVNIGDAQQGHEIELSLLYQDWLILEMICVSPCFFGAIILFGSLIFLWWGFFASLLLRGRNGLTKMIVGLGEATKVSEWGGIKFNDLVVPCD